MSDSGSSKSVYILTLVVVTVNHFFLNRFDFFFTLGAAPFPKNRREIHREKDDEREEKDDEREGISHTKRSKHFIQSLIVEGGLPTLHALLGLSS